MVLLDTASAIADRPAAQNLFSPLIDFLCLGGGSLLLLPILTFLVPDSANGSAILLAALLSNVINHPHFIHSYQIFYRTFPDLVSSRADRPLRLRYLVAGVVVPAILAIYFVIALESPALHLLAYSANAMMFFVGWHYAKQGFGMLMVDAALKRSFYAPDERRVLLLNSYLCWITAWLFLNKAATEQKFWGLAYFTFDVPDILFWASFVGLAVTSAWTALVMFQHARRHGRNAPLSGAAAYVAALYPWLFLPYEPVLSALIPAMHSLQYEIVVWRYQLNVERSKDDPMQPATLPAAAALRWSRSMQRFLGFMVRAVVIGGVAFWGVPLLLETYAASDHFLRGEYVFFFVIIVFINIHHYFIDNAMWRKENPHTLRFLFARH